MASFQYQSTSIVPNVAYNGANIASFSTNNPTADPNTAAIGPPASQSGGEGGLAELTVSYSCSGAITATKTFNVPTFQLTNYWVALETDSDDGLNLCMKQYGNYPTGITQIGPNDPTGLPQGSYCSGFLSEMQVEGDGKTRNNIYIHYAGHNKYELWTDKDPAFNPSDPAHYIYGAAGQSYHLMAGKTVACDNLTVNLTADIMLATPWLGTTTWRCVDTGGAIQGYHLDLFTGEGRQSGSTIGLPNMINRVVVGACPSGTFNCPDLSIP
jgi:hypothetical protein